MNDPLLSRANPSSNKRKRLLAGSLLPNFIIPTPYSKKNKVLVSFSFLASIILCSTIIGALALILNKHAHFGGTVLVTFALD